MGVKPREGEKGSGWSKKLRFRSGAAPACFPRSPNFEALQAVN
jgi:hypothetical protein